MSGFALHSSSIAFILSSNCPRYFVPATIDAKSRVKILLPVSVGDASPSSINCAKPSTIADLPTPGSPMIIGLFFFLRESIWDILLISFSRPITLSTSPFSTALDMSLQKLSNTGVLALIEPSLLLIELPLGNSPAGFSSSLYALFFWKIFSHFFHHIL
jgi:hypothetical protein